jgi:hypothetical protein
MFLERRRVAKVAPRKQSQKGLHVKGPRLHQSPMTNEIFSGWNSAHHYRTNAKMDSLRFSLEQPMAGDHSASRQIDAKIKGLGDWRGETLARLRALIREAAPDIVEDVKWRKPSNPSGVPVWEQAGLVCTGETYKDKVKLTFGNGASVQDPSGLFNSSLDGNARRAIDMREGEEVDPEAFKTLVRAAVVVNIARSRK